jgi:hypothetical protein
MLTEVIPVIIQWAQKLMIVFSDISQRTGLKTKLQKNDSQKVKQTPQVNGFLIRYGIDSIVFSTIFSLLNIRQSNAMAEMIVLVKNRLINMDRDIS